MTNPGKQPFGPSNPTESTIPSSLTINTTTSDLKTTKDDHPVDQRTQLLNPIGKAISQLTTNILATLIYRSLTKLALFYPTIVNKQTAHPLTVNQLKMRPTHPEYHKLIPKIIPSTLW